MKCPECEAPSEVRESRQREDGLVRRRRVCISCGHRWTTVEMHASDHEALLGVSRSLYDTLYRRAGGSKK